MHRIISALGLCLGLISCGPVAAEGWDLPCDRTPDHWGCSALQLHGLSRHASGQWNERNWGAGVRYQPTRDWGVQAGFYKNSMSRQSKYILAQWTPLHYGGLSAGVFGGLVTGYKTPVAAGLIATAQAGRWSATVRGVPPTPQSPAFATFEIGVQL